MGFFCCCQREGSYKCSYSFIISDELAANAKNNFYASSSKSMCCKFFFKKTKTNPICLQEYYKHFRIQMELSEEVLQGCQMWHFTQSFSLWAPSEPSAAEETTIETVTHFWEQAGFQCSALTALGHVWESVTWACWGLQRKWHKVLISRGKFGPVRFSLHIPNVQYSFIVSSGQDTRQTQKWVWAWKHNSNEITTGVTNDSHQPCMARGRHLDVTKLIGVMKNMKKKNLKKCYSMWVKPAWNSEL